MRISFVIPAYNEADYISGALASITEQVREHGCDAEVIVVDNASTDETTSVAASYPGVRVVREERKGIVWARRAGYEAATGQLIANIDADNRLTPGWLNTVLTEFAADEELLALSGPLEYYDLPRWKRVLVSWVFYRTGYAFAWVSGKLFGKHGMLQGGNYIVRREVIERIGGFDTSIEFYGEDIDVGRRISEIGKILWTFRLPIYSSARRMDGEGFFVMGYTYAMNFLWTTFLKRPFSKTYTDYRNYN